MVLMRNKKDYPLIIIKYPVLSIALGLFLFCDNKQTCEAPLSTKFMFFFCLSFIDMILVFLSFYTPPHISGGYYVFMVAIRVSVHPSVHP